MHILARSVWGGGEHLQTATVVYREAVSAMPVGVSLITALLGFRVARDPNAEIHLVF